MGLRCEIMKVYKVRIRIIWLLIGSDDSRYPLLDSADLVFLPRNCFYLKEAKQKNPLNCQKISPSNISLETPWPAIASAAFHAHLVG